MFEHLDLITVRIAYGTNYKVMSTRPSPKVKKYMDIISEAGQYYIKMFPYFKRPANWKGFDKFTLINSIQDIVQNEQRFKQHMGECFT